MEKKRETKLRELNDLLNFVGDVRQLQRFILVVCAFIKDHDPSLARSILAYYFEKVDTDSPSKYNHQVIWNKMIPIIYVFAKDRWRSVDKTYFSKYNDFELIAEIVGEDVYNHTG